MTRLVTAYLGGCSVQIDGTTVTLGSRRTEALFAYLAHTAEPHSREHLAELMWEPGNPSRSAGNLRVLLSNLRREVGDHVEISRAAVRIAGDADVYVDSARFIELAEKALVRKGSDDFPTADDETSSALQITADMCKGELLSHLDVQGAPAFDDWLRDERTRVHGLWARVLARLVECELAMGQFGRAAEHAGLLIRVEPWQDLSHQLMIRARRATGDDVAALKHFEMFDAQHRQEFGSPAGALTRDLVSDLVHHDGPVPLAPRTATPAHPRGGGRQRLPWSRFAARRSELGTIVSRYAEAAAGRGNVLVVRGTSGAGKTALVRRSVNLIVEKDPALVVLGGAGEDPARSGQGDLLVDRLLAQRSGDTSGGWLDGPMSGAIAERVRALGALPSAGRNRNASPLAELAGSVRELAARHPLLLVIDDFQWTSPSTRNLVADLARGIHALPLFLLIATQPAQPVATDTGVGSASWLLDRIGETAGLTSIDLDEGYGGPRARAFVQGVVDTERHVLPAGLIDEVGRLGAGHPLTTVELLRDLVKRGQVAPDPAGTLVLTGPVAWPTMPDRLVRLLDEQVADLPDHLATLLEVAAVHGSSFDVAAVAASCRHNLGDVIRAFGRHLGLRGHGLVEPLADGGPGGHTHRFRQPVLREHLLSRMDPHERQLLERSVAGAAGAG